MDRKQAQLLQQPDPLKPARHFVPELPAALDAVLMRALVVEPELRLPTVVDLKQQLERVLAQAEPVAPLELATVPVVPMVKPEPPPVPKSPQPIPQPVPPKPEAAPPQRNAPPEPPHQTTPAPGGATPPHPRRGIRGNLTWIAVIVIIGLAAGGGWWIGKTSPDSPKPIDSPAAPVAATPPIATPAPVTKPNPTTRRRFTDNSDGTVTDNQSRLVWLKDANCFGRKDWSTAMDSAKRLKNGQCGLSDGSVAGQWRLPSEEEWETLMDKSTVNPALPAGNPFTGVRSLYYWSSTSTADNAFLAVYVLLDDGDVQIAVKTSTYSVWPVRGGR